MNAIDKIRAEIMARRDHWRTEGAVADQNLALANAELEAHDRAVAAMEAVSVLTLCDGTQVNYARSPQRHRVQKPVMGAVRPAEHLVGKRDHRGDGPASRGGP